MKKLEQAAQQALGALVRAEAMYGQPNADIQTALREALDHFADAGNMVPDHIAASGKVILTTEQAQKIEEALAFAASHSEYLADDLILYGEALATIRAAKAQVGQGPVNDVCVRCGGNCPRFMCDTYKDWADKEPVSRECLIAPVKQAEQEPVAFLTVGEFGGVSVSITSNAPVDVGRYPLYAAPVQQAEQEPVAWAHPSGGHLSARYMKEFATGLEKETHTIPLYTAPVRTKDLTDGAIWEILETHPADIITAIRAVITADREKNK